MSTVTLRNTNPLGQVDLPLIGREEIDGSTLGVEGVGCLEPGEEFEIDAELAGFPPSGSVEDGTYHPGTGLLAQVGNYAHVSGDLIIPADLPDSPDAPAPADVAPAIVDDPTAPEG